MAISNKQVFDVYFAIGLSDRVIAIRLNRGWGKKRKVKRALLARIGPNRFLRMVRRKDLEGAGGEASPLIMRLE